MPKPLASLLVPRLFARTLRILDSLNIGFDGPSHVPVSGSDSLVREPDAVLFHDDDPDGISDSVFKNPESSVHFIQVHSMCD